MYYIIYPDTLFLENFICNLVFLTFMKSLFFPAAKGKKIIFISAVTALCNMFASILFFRRNIIFQIGVLFPASGLMTSYCLEIKDKRRMLFLLYQMSLWALVLGGIFQVLEQWIEIKDSLIFISTVLLVIVFGILEKILKVYKRQNNHMREVILYWNGKSCHMKGFADTGNHLLDPVSQNPVSIITFEAWHRLAEEEENVRYYLIPYKSVGNPQGLIPVIRIDCMVISEGEHSQIIEKPMIAITKQPFTGIFHYSILLHSDFC